jgi:hypothetical protein
MPYVAVNSNDNSSLMAIYSESSVDATTKRERKAGPRIKSGVTGKGGGGVNIFPFSHAGAGQHPPCCWVAVSRSLCPDRRWMLACASMTG